MSDENKMEMEQLKEQMREERRDYNEMLNLLVNIQKDYTRSNKMKDIIVIVLVVLMFLEAVAGYAGFLWWESQWEYSETVTTEVYTEGDNANAEYNNNEISGNQYNDSTHNEVPEKNEGNEE